ncbi:MAG: ThuA domain-containing protein [Pirellulales bacterium]|nr:ThuA domain-containing protein [Pirellulales bacterium]
MKRRDMLLSTGAAIIGLSAGPLRRVVAEPKKPKVLYFTRSVDFEHSAVRRDGNNLSISERVLSELGEDYGVDVTCTKDGRVFDEDLTKYSAIAFYTCGDLTKPSPRKTPPMTTRGKQRLLDAVAGGVGFVGIHSATDTFHSEGPRGENQEKVDPYIAMIGGEFISHGPQQVATMRVTSPYFPGIKNQGAPESFELNEEWYSLKNFAKDIHVILVQETEGMKGDCYQRPPFPATWARMHGKGRVLYTSLGHRHDVWTNEEVQTGLVGGFSWVMGRADAEIPANIDKVTPDAAVLKRKA